MNEQELTRFMREKDGALSLAFPALMRKVYVWMSLALIITGITAYGVASSPGLITAFYTNQMLMWGVVIAEFALVFALSAALNRLSLSVATLLFVVYSVLNGVMFSSIFLVYTMSSVANVFFITAGTFAAMAAYGYFTKSNLTTLSKYLFMALIGFVIATVVNIFVGSSMLSLVISYAGVLIFVGLTAYDSQKIKQMLAQQVDADETAQKIALFGALTLYLDFINLFLYLLRLLGNRR